MARRKDFIRISKNPKKDLSESRALVPKSGRTLPILRDPLQQYLSEVSQFPVLSREDEAKIAKHYTQFHDKESAQTLVVSNLRLVVKIALEYSQAFHNILDLIQEGNMGLMRAVTKYDASKGTRFSYYAAWWIRAFILKYIIDNFRLVKVGTTQAQKKLFYNLMKEKQKMEAMGFAPKTKLLSEKLDVKEKDIVEMDQRMSRRDMSLDAPSPGADDKINMDYFASKDLSAEVQVEEAQLKRKLFENLDEFIVSLNEKEKKIFLDRLYAEVPKTLQEIADEYGITRERIRQLEERTVKKLRQFFSQKGFDIDVAQSKKEKS